MNGDSTGEGTDEQEKYLDESVCCRPRTFVESNVI